MNFKYPSTIEESIVEALALQPESWEKLLKNAQKIKTGFTKQALYVVLRRLIKQEVVIKHGTQFSLSKVWLGNMYNFFLMAQDRYGAEHQNVDFLSLKDGDKISYNFKSPEESDRFSGHAFTVLGDIMPHAEPIYLYNPHEWFLVARSESEKFLFEKLRSEKRILWVLADNNDYLDREARKFFDGTYLQYHILDRKLFDKNYYYINILGNFIFEFFFDRNTANNIDAFYKRTTILNDGTKKELQDIVSKGKTKVTISHNSRKATKLKKLLGQYFYKSISSRIGQ